MGVVLCVKRRLAAQNCALALQESHMAARKWLHIFREREEEKILRWEGARGAEKG